MFSLFLFPIRVKEFERRVAKTGKPTIKAISIKIKKIKRMAENSKYIQAIKNNKWL
jgi:guanylate kinase